MDDWAHEVRMLIWATLLEGSLPRSEELAHLRTLWAVRESLSEQSRLALRVCLACARLAQDGTAGLREELRIFLAYYLSRDGSAPIANLPEPRSAQELTLEWLRGREPSWEEIFKIFGRTANPDRVRKLLHEQLEQLGG
ncbi:hypothetical protein LM602_02590 [Candidatus Acetothermia bacterium]|jgi:hypothetical protein|nr:hypothetical protein [Candidatus Acetothermia bacterium]MCI2431431.1 hypothetical protein [Candidatus Acetothermia bacterium]MCI2436706.1 hypothetical protein [Candidatus Acetothermia bacterium]